MATGSISLPIGAAVLPDGSTGNAAPGIARVKSSASAPSPHFLQALFDALADEMCYWSFRMPANYSSDPVLKIQYKMASATTGSIRFEGRIAAVTDGDAQDVDANGLDTTNSAGATVPGTAGHLDEVSIPLANNDTLAANDFVIAMLRRDADGTTGTDNAAGDAEVVAVALEYTTS